MTRYAEPIYGAVVVRSHGEVEGTHYITTDCADFDAYKALPNAVIFDGYTLAKTGWDSDKQIACFQDSARLAYAVR